MEMIRTGNLKNGIGKGWKGKMIWEPLGVNLTLSRIRLIADTDHVSSGHVYLLS